MPRTRKTELKLENQLRPPKNYGKKPRTNRKAKDLVRLGIDDDNKVIFISGPAGSTKTFMAAYCTKEIKAK